ncbi:MAG TPA: hypothetical protein VK177_16070 [Flavobacteriales bacterium]|nr:hypothetical protein [Flavobacteriales bacterium]
MKKPFIAIFFCALFACTNSEKKEALAGVNFKSLVEIENDKPHKRINFKVDGQSFLMNSMFIAGEREIRDGSGRKVQRLYLVQNDFKQSLDILFPPLSSNMQFPITFKFADKSKADPNNIDYAICLWSSYSNEGWHQVPLNNSYITITKWDPSTKIASGTFQLTIQNARLKNQTIKITDGTFINIPFTGENAGPSVSVPAY